MHKKPSIVFTDNRCQQEAKLYTLCVEISSWNAGWMLHHAIGLCARTCAWVANRQYNPQTCTVCMLCFLIWWSLASQTMLLFIACSGLPHNILHFNYGRTCFFLLLCSLLGIIIYWLLLFIVGILLLNILVVQFIHSYEDEAGRAQLNVVLTRTRLLHSMEKSYWAKRIIKVYCSHRRTSLSIMQFYMCLTLLFQLMKSRIKPLFWTRKVRFFYKLWLEMYHFMYMLVHLQYTATLSTVESGY